MQEVKIKNKSNIKCFVDEMPKLENIPPPVLQAFVKHYEMQVYDMFLKKRTKSDKK